MKKAGVFVASIAAASSAALPPGSSDNSAYFPCCSSYSQKGFQTETKGKDKRSVTRKEEARDEKDKFAPRFDGLRFIETLVTAHR